MQQQVQRHRAFNNESLIIDCAEKLYFVKNGQKFTSQISFASLTASRQQPQVKHSNLDPAGKQRLHQLNKQRIYPQWRGKKRVNPKQKSMFCFDFMCPCGRVSAFIFCFIPPSELHCKKKKQRRRKKFKQKLWISLRWNYKARSIAIDFYSSGFANVYWLSCATDGPERLMGCMHVLCVVLH